MIGTRIVSAVVLVALLLGVLLLLPAVWTLVFFTLVILIGAWEWSAFMRVSSLPLRLAYVALIGALLAGGWFASADSTSLRAMLAIAGVWWLFALVWIAFLPMRLTATAAGLAGILTLVPAWVALTRMRLDWEQGAYWTLFLLALVACADTGAFVAGKLFGRHKLAPQVSPGKTWEGAAGGLLFAGLLAVGAARWFGVPWLPLVAASVLIGVFSIVGDLTESMLKRHAGLKDSGAIIPGHGGVMDRIDSITAAAPLLALALPFVLATGVAS